jgi:hypothetical protein
MGKKGQTKYEGMFHKNQLFNKWIVIDEKVVMIKEARLLCKCTECNITEKYVPIIQLIKNVSKRCSVCGYSRKQNENPAWKGYKEIPFAWFSKYFLRKGRKKQGEVTIEDIYDLWVKQNKKCNLSGIQIDFIKRKEGVSASIDRIDSSKEYVKDNIQLVHKDINLMKNHFNQDYFLDICEKIINERKRKEIS